MVSYGAERIYHEIIFQGNLIVVWPLCKVDEMVNISSPLRSRYQKAAPGLKRCLKLSMTDGVQRVSGMEYRPIKDLEVLSPAGLTVHTVIHFISLLLVLLPC